MSTELLLIDLSSIAHSLYHQSANEPDPNWTANRTVARVHALNNGKQSGVAVCLDTPPYFRKDIDPAYKANRQKEHNAAVAHQIAVAVDALKADGFPVWGAAGYEADDIIATGVRLSNGKNRDIGESLAGARAETPWLVQNDVVIASADKDLLQLVSDRVTVQSLKSGDRLDPDAVKAKFGVWPHQMVDYLALVGDTSDNVQGAKGIGAKRATEILELFGNLDDAMKATRESVDGVDPEGVPSISRSLIAFEPRLNTVRELIRLRTDAPIPFDEIFKERQPVTTEGFEDDREPMDETRPVDRGASPEVPAPHPVHDTEGLSAIKAFQNVIPTETPREVKAAIDVMMAPAKPKPDGPPESTALAVVEWDRQLEPRDMKQAYWIAQQLFQSKLFAAYGTPAAVLSTIMAGREMGFSTMASLRAFHIIEGKPTMSAGAIHSLVLKSGKAKFFRCVERSATKAVFETQRGDDPPFTMAYTIEEAQQAWSKDQSAWNRSGWGKHPADMLIARCSSKLARLVYPDVCHGLYSEEEM